jgi:hypothetical protein
MKYDGIILGSGQAGNPLWDSLTDRGWNVALVEKAHLGETYQLWLHTDEDHGGISPNRALRAKRRPLGRTHRPGKRRSAAHRRAKDAIVRQFRDGKQSQAESR